MAKTPKGGSSHGKVIKPVKQIPFKGKAGKGSKLKPQFSVPVKKSSKGS